MPLSEQSFEALLAALRGGHLRAGAFFSMPELARQLGYPIAAIREASKLAEARGLLHIMPKRGVTVMDAGAQVTRDCMDMRAALEREGARRIVSGEVAFPLKALRDSHEAMLVQAKQAVPNLTGAAAIEVDLSLHDALAGGLTNPFLRECYQANRDRVAVIQNTRPFLVDRIVSAMEEHLQIIAAIEARDLAQVLGRIDHHLVQTLRWWGI